MSATTKLAPGQTLSETLSLLSDNDLKTLLRSLAGASHEIAGLCRRGLAQKISTTNVFGDEQLALDVAADAALMEAARASGVVRIASSEETPREVPLTGTGRFVIAFDPLDGSSIIGCNFAVGSIVGVWEKERLVGAAGKDMVAAVVTVYGPRTTMFVAVRDGAWEGVVEYVLGGVEEADDGVWTVSRVVREIREGKLFAPANLRCATENEGYRLLVEWWMRERYTLRYTGGMVPDVTQILVKGHGVFASPASAVAPAKLRLAYEAMPMAFLVEQAGGASSDGISSVIARAVHACDERTVVCLGSRAEVARFDAHCGSAASRR